jgi:hypothetical protein
MEESVKKYRALVAVFTAMMIPNVVLAQTAEPLAQEEDHWYDDISIGAFADAFYLVDWNMPANPQAWGDAPHRAYDYTNGFGLAFAGLDVAYKGEKVGATMSLRYGAGAARLIGNSNSVLSTVSQAFVTWTPSDKLTFDLGTFGTIYGAEVAENWQNINYTRGALYFLMQPFYHTGLRASYQVSDTVGLTALVVNGTNLNGLVDGFGEDGNQSPHLGLQLTLAPMDAFNMAVGWYGGSAGSGFGPNHFREDGNWEHFFDVVATGELGKLSYVGNFDFYVIPDGDGAGNAAYYWGISAGAAYALTDTFGLAGRLEYLDDPKSQYISGAYDGLLTATATLQYKPSKNILLRLDAVRLEKAFGDGAEIYSTRNGNSSLGITSTLGMVVYGGY